MTLDRPGLASDWSLSGAQSTGAGIAAQPRAIGSAGVAARRRGEASVVADLYESGSAKIRLPRTAGPGLQAVTLNTAGGLTGGDHLRYAAEAREGSHLTLASQTAERAYRTQPGQVARLDVTLTVGPGATLEWLAQETILFDACALDRRIRVDMAPDATLLLVEPVVFGRVAMGERVLSGRFRDSQRLSRDGHLVYADETRIEGPVDRIVAAEAALGPNRAYATIIFSAPDAESRLSGLRALIDPGEGGASAFDGLISARIVSHNGYELRRRLMHVLREFRESAPPRVWEM